MITNQQHRRLTSEYAKAGNVTISALKAAVHLRQLPQFHFIARRKAGGEVRGVVTP